MNVDLQNKNARLRYDINTGDLIEVTFALNPSEDAFGAFMEIPYDIAVAFMQDKLRMGDHTVSLNEYSELIVVRKEEVEYKRTFWELLDAESKDSPIQMTSKNTEGFSIKPLTKNKMYSIYVTEHNDPNKLLLTKKSSQFDILENGDLFCKVDLDRDYSIYVRNYVT